MRDPLAPVIEGVDLSGIVNRYSFQCEPFFTDRNESQTMLDGSTVHDVFPLKARFSWTLNALSAEQYAALNAALRDTVSAQIFDPTINAVRSARFHVTRPAFVYNFTTSHYMSTDGGALILEDAAPRALPSVTPATRPTAANRDPLAPVINGYDLSGMVNKYSFQCEPFTTDGNNAGTLQDGSTVLDVLANKFRLSWTLNAISAQQYADLCAVLSSGTDPDTVSASVYNPILNATYTVPFHVTFPVFRFVLDNGQCMAYADSALTLQETNTERGLVITGGDDWRLYDDGTLEIDPLPDGSPETEDDRWRRILDDLDNPGAIPENPIETVDRVVLKPDIPSLPSGVVDQFPNIETIVIPPDVTIAPDAFDNSPDLVIIKIVSFPSRGDYIAGDTLDYTGLYITETTGETERDITPECVLHPADGYVTTEPGDIPVEIRYHDKWIGGFWVAVAEVEVVASDDWWTLYNNGLLDIYCVGTMPSVAFAANSWLSYKSQITSATIANSVTSINAYAFNACRNLTSVAIPNSVISIGFAAFSYCEALPNITIPSGVISIDKHAFIECHSFASITFPDSVTSIGDEAFYNCENLTSVTIGSGLTSIGRTAFGDCLKLVEITVDNANLKYSDLDGVFFDKQKTTLIQYPAGKSATSYTIPDSVTSISESTFLSSKLFNVTIPDSVTSIGQSAFYGCINLTNITIPDNVTGIEKYTFRNCTALGSVTIGNSVTSIGRSAFSGCRSLAAVIIPDSVTSIGENAFLSCSGLTNVYYGGDKAQWQAINIDSSNYKLREAKIHYNSSGAVY